MTQDEIIEMARQAGLLGETNGWDVWFPDNLEAFVKLVAAKEREACAMACIDIAHKWTRMGAWGQNTEYHECAEAIRARGGA